ncbi:MAG: PAS domain S-box protein, partial [Chloroflexi bacterium]
MLHQILQRQLKKLGLSPDQPPTPETWRAFLERINAAYEQADQDRYLLERAMAISSREMRELNESLRKTAENQITLERNRHQAIMEHIVDGVITFNSDGYIQSFNPAAERIFGYTAKEIVGQHINDLLSGTQSGSHPTDKLNLQSNTEASIQHIRNEVVGRRKNGDMFPMELAVSNMLFGDQQLFIAVVRDISEQKKIESLLYNKLKFEELITTISTKFINLAPEEIDNGINEALGQIGQFVQVDRSYIFLISEDKQTVSNTHEWCAPGILPAIEYLQNVPANTMPWWMDKIEKQEVIHIPCVADLPPEASNEKELLKAQEIQSLIVVPLVYNRQSIGFFGFDAVRTQREWDEDSIRLFKILGEIFVNALARKQVAEQLQQQRDFALQVMNTMGQGLTVADTEWRFEYVNPTFARMLGYTPEELIGKTPFDITVKEDWPKLHESRNKRFSGADETYELRLRRKDGSHFYALVTGAPRFQNGKVVGSIGVITDLTERKKSEEELAQKAAELAALYRASTQLFASGDLNSMAQQIATTVTSEFEFADCAVVLLEEPLEINELGEVVGNMNGRILSVVQLGEYQHDTVKSLRVNGPGLIA